MSVVLQQLKQNLVYIIQCIDHFKMSLTWEIGSCLCEWKGGGRGWGQGGMSTIPTKKKENVL